MLRANFLYQFFKSTKNNSNEIIKYNSYEKFDLVKDINTKILEIDQQISEHSKTLLETQIVKLRSTFSQSNNFIEKIGKNVYKEKIEESIIWHQRQLKELYLTRRNLQISLEKIKGTFWLNSIKRFLRIIFIGFLILSSLFIFLSGFMIILYLLPLIIFIFIGYWITTKNN